MPPLHPTLAHVAGLLGTWTGRGRGAYPTIDSFGYDEIVTFGHVGKPFLTYTQRTTSLTDPPTPMHAETGYWRFPDRDRVEIILSHPTGIGEIEEGSVAIDGDTMVIDVATTHVAGTATAKHVSGLARRFTVAGDDLAYEVAMAAVGQPLQFHLAATLVRVSDKDTIETVP